jgi:hypothetical protein
MAAASFPFGVTAILLALNLRIDILVLSHYVSSRILGQFNAAAWFVVAMFLCASLLMSVLFPRLSRVLAEPGGLGSDYIRSLVKNVLMFAAGGLASSLECCPRSYSCVLWPRLCSRRAHPAHTVSSSSFGFPQHDLLLCFCSCPAAICLPGNTECRNRSRYAAERLPVFTPRGRRRRDGRRCT